MDLSYHAGDHCSFGLLPCGTVSFLRGGHLLCSPLFTVSGSVFGTEETHGCFGSSVDRWTRIGDGKQKAGPKGGCWEGDKEE